MPVDFRKGRSAVALVRDGGADPFNGALYVFRSKKADRIKAVWFDGTGVCLFAKTLEDAIPLAPDWAGHVAIEPCAVACAGRRAGLEEGSTGGCEAAAIDGLKTCGILDQAFEGLETGGEYAVMAAMTMAVAELPDDVDAEGDDHRHGWAEGVAGGPHQPS